jgi:SAM-dependent methyltransferase
MIKKQLIRLYWIVSTQGGFDVRILLRSLRGIFRFVRDWKSFTKSYSGKWLFRPCLQDWYDEGGTTRNEYFQQDLLVARMIHAANPQKHVDVGSRVDGFVAHVASFREIEVFDVRNTTATIPGIVFRQADMMSPVQDMSEYCDSLSCLHALEHFGLGRYGDPIDPEGYQRGFANMVRLLKPAGKFYLSVPIGLERVEFNANRVFDPRTVVHMGRSSRLVLEKMFVINPDGLVIHVDKAPQALSLLADYNYRLGIFIFRKDHALRKTIKHERNQ